MLGYFCRCRVRPRAHLRGTYPRWALARSLRLWGVLEPQRRSPELQETPQGAAALVQAREDKMGIQWWEGTGKKGDGLTGHQLMDLPARK